MGAKSEVQTAKTEPSCSEVSWLTLGCLVEAADSRWSSSPTTPPDLAWAHRLGTAGLQPLAGEAAHGDVFNVRSDAAYALSAATNESTDSVTELSRVPAAGIAGIDEDLANRHECQAPGGVESAEGVNDEEGAEVALAASMSGNQEPPIGQLEVDPRGEQADR